MQTQLKAEVAPVSSDGILTGLLPGTVALSPPCVGVLELVLD